MRSCLILCSVLLACPAFARQARIPDSLKGKEYRYFEEATFTLKDPAKLSVYGKAWLEKARNDKDYAQQAAALRIVMLSSGKGWMPRYLDTLMAVAEKSHDHAVIGKAWLTKGIYHYGNYEHGKALDSYMKADDHLSRSGDHYDVYKLKYAIANTKYYLGFYDEAIALLRQCLDYFAKEDARGYLNTLYSLALCHTQLKNYSESSRLNNEGLAMGKEMDESGLEPYFIYSEGINAYCTGKYNDALAKLNTALPSLVSAKDIPNTAVAWFYLGKTYRALGQDNKALPYFKKVDLSFNERRYIRPDLRQTYELLIDYYKAQNNQTQQLYYTNRLLKVDSVLIPDFKYLSGKIRKEYDTRHLLRSKAELEGAVKFRNNLVVGLAGVFVVTITFLVNRHFSIRKNYRRKYEELMLRHPGSEEEPAQPSKVSVQDFSPEFLAATKKGLEKFEQDKKYLAKDMDLQKLAGYLNTNMKYASRIVLHYRDKKTIEYIRDLKVDYVVDLLKSQNKYRNYTDKALAEEAGFGSTQNFTRAFKARTEMPPRYFISQLKKDAAEN